MFRAMVAKELRAILRSPKFLGSFLTCSALILISLGIGFSEYRTSLRRYETALSLNEQRMSEQTSWTRLTTAAYRTPEPLQTFVSGVTYDVGRFTPIEAREAVQLTQSLYSEDPLFAFFRMCDLGFIVSVVISLLALLFTFDAICGEKEDGTLRLALSNGVPRARFLLAKGVGAWLGLVLPLSVPIAIGLLVVVVAGLPMDGGRWLRLGALLGASLLLFSFFIALGLLVSTLSKRPGHAFLAALLTWVILVLVLPRAAIVTAAQFLPVPGVAEIEGLVAAFSRDQMTAFQANLLDLARGARDRSAGGGSAESKSVDHEGARISIEEHRMEMERKIDAFRDRLLEDLRNRRRAQQRLGFSLARLSPVAAYQLAAMNLTESDADLKDRFEEEARSYRAAFLDYTQKRQAESGEGLAVRIESDGKSSVRVPRPREASALNLSEIPRFQPHPRGTVARLAASAADLGWLAIASLGAFAIAFIRFRNYDVR